MDRALTARPWRAALAVVLACALVFFTSVYRNSSAFSPATAARCHSLSADHTNARTLFGDFGPLWIQTAAPMPPAPSRPEARLAGTVRTAPAHPLALIASPVHRPPPGVAG